MPDQSASQTQGSATPAPQFLSSGSPTIDQILGGGIPRHALMIITGAPGAGKTILAQQISFAGARAALRVIYFTNVSEPHDKLVAHMRGLDFFDQSLLGNQIKIYNVSGQLHNSTFSEALGFIVSVVRQERADLAVIDSFRGLRHILEPAGGARSAIFDLGAQLGLLQCTAILVGEYTPSEMQTDPEFAIADGVMHLWHAYEGAQERRSLRVVKLRGARYLGGEHALSISSSGIEAFPRPEALAHAPSHRATEERASAGIAALDEMVGGGLIRSSSTLLAGPSGVGKTILALHFLAAGAEQNERGMMVSFRESPEQLALRAGHFGLRERLDLDAGCTTVLSLSPVELDVDRAAWLIRQAVEQRGVRRVVIDSLAELEGGVRDQGRFDDFLAALIGFLRGSGATTIMTRESAQLFGGELGIAGRGLSHIADNIILLRYVELEAAIRRAITALKVRGSNHDKRLLELLIEPGRVAIGQQLTAPSSPITDQPAASDAA